jgi:hypothetical protein
MLHQVVSFARVSGGSSIFCYARQNASQCRSYKIVDETTLSGPVILHSENGTTKAVVTLKKTADNRFTVHWSNVMVDGENADDWNLVVERK